MLRADLNNLRLTATPHAMGKWAAHYQQTYHGLDVWNAKVRIVISDPETLRLWWSRATADTPEPKPPLPTIDFQANSVLLVAAGRSNAGDRIRVDSIGFDIRPAPGGGRDEVWFAIVRTIPDCNPFPGTAFPLEFVRVPKVTGRFDFVDRVVACPGDRQEEGVERPKSPDPHRTKR